MSKDNDSVIRERERERETHLNFDLKSEDDVKEYLREKMGKPIKVGQTTTFLNLGFTTFDVNKIQDSIKKLYKIENSLKKEPDGWYFPEDITETAIVIETKSPKNKLGEDEEKQLKSYIYISATKYKKVIGILFNGFKVRLFKYIKGDIVELIDNVSNKIEQIDYYLNLYNSKEIDKSFIYECTYKINDIFYKHIKIKSLIQRMIFTASMLIAKKNGAEYSPLKKRIEEDISKSKKYESKVRKLYEFFSTIEPIIDAKDENIIIKSKKILLENIDNIVEEMDSPNWKGEDVMSIFFNEFSRYKGEIRNGQVFTPDHITTFMYKIANVNKNSNILDACCGSGSFLVKSMALMIDEAGGDITSEAINIKTNHLFGIENDPEIYALACANMLLHKDGKTNLELADATSKEMYDWIKSKKINKVLMNPPYEDQFKCLEIVKNVLDATLPNADCLFLLPNNKLTKHWNKNTNLSNKILENHKLLKIIKLPPIFKGLAGAGDVSIFYFKSHEPQKNSEIVSYWIKDDGYATVKNKGRQDLLNIWSIKDGLEDKWLKIIANNKDEESKNIIDPKTGKLEYQTDISFEICEDDFLKVIIDRFMFENPNIAKLFNLKSSRIGK